jgi:hypothetical protein
MPPKTGHQRVKQLDYYEDNLYDDDDYSDEGGGDGEYLIMSYSINKNIC